MAYKDDKKFSAEDFLSFEAIDDLFNSENKYYLKDIDTNDANGYTPLCAAILNNADPLMLLYLTGAKLYVNYRDSYSGSKDDTWDNNEEPKYTADKEDDLLEDASLVKLSNCLPKEFRNPSLNGNDSYSTLLSHGADVIKKCGKGKTPLQIAIMAGNATAIKTLLGQNKITVDVHEYVGDESYGYYKKLIYYDDSCQPIYESDSDGNPTEEYKYYKIKLMIPTYYSNKIEITPTDILNAASMATSDVLDALADSYSKVNSDKYANGWDIYDGSEGQSVVLQSVKFDNLNNTPMIVAAKAQCYDSIKTIIEGITGQPYSLAPSGYITISKKDNPSTITFKQAVANAVWHMNLAEPDGDEDTCVNDIAVENDDQGLIEVLAPYCCIIDKDGTKANSDNKNDTANKKDYPGALPAKGAYTPQSDNEEEPSDNEELLDNEEQSDSKESITVSAVKTGPSGNDLAVTIEKSDDKAIVKVFKKGKESPIAVSEEISQDDDGYIQLNNIQSDEGDISKKVKLNGKIRFDNISDEDGVTINLAGGKDKLDPTKQGSDFPEPTKDDFLTSAFKLKDDHSIAKFTFDSLRNKEEDEEANIFNLKNDSDTSNDDLLLFSSYEYGYDNATANESSEESSDNESEEQENESEESDDESENNNSDDNKVDRSKYKNILSIINENLNIVDEDNDSEDTVTLYNLIKDHIDDLPASSRNGHSFKRDFCTETEYVNEGQACYNLINKLYNDGTLDSLDKGVNYINVLSDIEGDSNDKLPSDFHRKVGTLKRCNSNAVSFKTEYLYLANFEGDYYRSKSYINSWVGPSIKPEDINDIFSFDFNEINEDSKYSEVEIYTLDSDGNPVIIRPTHFSINRADNITVRFRTKDNSEINTSPNNSAVIVKVKTAVEVKNESSEDANDEENNSSEDIQYEIVTKTFDLEASDIYEIDGNETNVRWKQSKSLYKLLRGKAISDIVKEDVAGFEFDVDNPNLKEGEVTTLTITLLSKPDANITVTIETDENNNGRLSLSSDTIEFTQEDWDIPHSIDLEAVHDYIAYGNIDVLVTLTPSGDYSYDKVQPETVTVSIQEIDEAGIEYDDAPISLIEGGDSVTRLFNLTSKPLDNIIVNFTDYNQSRLNVLPTSLTFTPEDWSDQQEVKFTAINNDIDDGTVDTTVTVSLSGDGGSYDSIISSLLDVTIENNDIAGVEYSNKEDIELTEGDQPITREFWLSSEPENNVILKFSSNKPSRLTVAPSSLTFTPSNWRDHQAITLTPASDNYSVDNDVNAIITITVDDSSDTKYKDLNLDPLNVKVLDNDKAGIRFKVSSSTLNSGSSGTVTFNLTSKPTSNVIISLSSDTDRLSISPQSVTLTPQILSSSSITLRAVNDYIDYDDIVAHVTVTATSSDTNYNNITVDFSLNIVDTNTAGLDYDTSSISLVEGNSTTRAFKLKSKPTSSVTLNFSSNKPSNLTITPSQLTISQSDWDSGNNVTLTAINNDTATGMVSAKVSITVESNDTKYSSLTPTPFSVNINDNDIAGIVTSLQSNSLSEGESSILSFYFKSQPTDSVRVYFKSDNKRLTVSHSSKIVTPGNYNDLFQQMVTLKAVDNTTVDGNTTATVSITTTSYDSLYNNLHYDFVISVKDNDKITPLRFTVSYKNPDHTNLNDVNLPGDTLVLSGSNAITLEPPPSPNEYRESNSNIRWVAAGWRLPNMIAYYAFGTKITITDDTTFNLVCKKKPSTILYIFNNPTGKSVVRPSETTGPFTSGTTTRLRKVHTTVNSHTQTSLTIEQQNTVDTSDSFYVKSPYSIDGVLWVPKCWDISGTEYQFNGLRTVFNNMNASLVWKRQSVTLTYKNNSYSFLSVTLPSSQTEQSGTSINLTAPSKRSYLYNGKTYIADYWLINKSKYNFGSSYTLKKDTIAYIHVSVAEVTITYKNKTPLSVELPNSYSAASGTPVKLPIINGTYYYDNKKWEVIGWTIGSELHLSDTYYTLNSSVDAWLERKEVGGPLGTAAFTTSIFAIDDDFFTKTITITDDNGNSTEVSVQDLYKDYCSSHGAAVVTKVNKKYDGYDT